MAAGIPDALGVSQSWWLVFHTRALAKARRYWFCDRVDCDSALFFMCEWSMKKYGILNELLVPPWSLLDDESVHVVGSVMWRNYESCNNQYLRIDLGIIVVLGFALVWGPV